MDMDDVVDSGASVSLAVESSLTERTPGLQDSRAR